MARTVTLKSWPTEAEARAFLEGLDFVNDSAISWEEPYQEGELWHVAVADQDEDDGIVPVIVQ